MRTVTLTVPYAANPCEFALDTRLTVASNPFEAKYAAEEKIHDSLNGSEYVNDFESVVFDEATQSWQVTVIIAAG